MRIVAWNPGVRDFLTKLGADPEVMDYIEGLEDPKLQGKLANEVRKQPTMGIDEVLAIAGAQPKKREPNAKEKRLIATFGGYEAVGKLNDRGEWLAVQLMKHRGKDDAFDSADMTLDEFNDLGNVVQGVKDWADDQHPALHNYTIEEAVSESDEWHEAQSSKKAGDSYDRTGEIAYTFDNGWTIREVKSENDLTREGNLMGHCVGGYCQKVKYGDARIFSLRDKQNQPHATIELAGDENAVIQIQGKSNKRPIKEYRELISEWLQSIGAFKKGAGESISHIMWEREELHTAHYAVDAYYGGDDSGDFDDSDEYGIPVKNEMEWTDPDELLGDIAERWEDYYRSDTRWHDSDIREVNEMGIEWADAVAAEIVRMCENGSKEDMAVSGKSHLRKVLDEKLERYTKEVLQRCAPYYNLYQVLGYEAKPNYWGRDKHAPSVYIERYRQETGVELRWPFEANSEEAKELYFQWADEQVVNMVPPFMLYRQVLVALGQQVFDLPRVERDAPGQQMLQFENPRRR